MIQRILSRKSKKATVAEMQQLCGFLNFIGKCVVPGRAFTRRLYAVTNGMKNRNLHVTLKADMRMDLRMWLQFLNNPLIYARPFIDFDTYLSASEINLFTDTSANPDLGCGGFNNHEWFSMIWDRQFIINNNPSIGYLELYAVTVAVILWIYKYRNKRVVLFCDNMSVVNMINNNTSKCRNCMVLIRLIVLHSMLHNTRVYAKHVRGVNNLFADLLSRKNVTKFKTLSQNKFNKLPCSIPVSLWPMQKLWLKQ